MQEPGDAAGMPPESFCLTCHVAVKADSPDIVKLRQYAAKGEHIPWVRIYKLPDFVLFSHKTHVEKAGLDCAACHGSVSRLDVLVQEKPVSMKACMDCHRAKNASVQCNLCHSPG